MTQITIERTVLEQVLKALNSMAKTLLKHEEQTTFDEEETINAVKRALAAPVKEELSEGVKISLKAQAMYATHPTFKGTTPMTWDEAPLSVRKEWIEKAQEQGEPIGHVDVVKGVYIGIITGEVGMGDKLYTTQQQRTPLTTAQIGVDPIFRAGVRFAENYHGIKE